MWGSLSLICFIAFRHQFLTPSPHPSFCRFLRASSAVGETRRGDQLGRAGGVAARSRGSPTLPITSSRSCESQGVHILSLHHQVHTPTLHTSSHCTHPHTAHPHTTPSPHTGHTLTLHILTLHHQVHTFTHILTLHHQVHTFTHILTLNHQVQILTLRTLTLYHHVYTLTLYTPHTVHTSHSTSSHSTSSHYTIMV